MKNDKNNDSSLDFGGIIKDSFGKSDYHHPDALTADEILKEKSDNISQNSALESLRKKVTGTAEEPKPASPKSLLDKCLPYILDEDGNNTSKDQKPLYELESVAEILRNDSQRTLEKLSKEYGIVFEGTPDPLPKAEEPKKEPETAVPPKAEEPPKTHEKEEIKIPVISDIDIDDSLFFKISPKEVTPQQTVTFTPIQSNDDNSQKTVVSSQTRPIDFTGELLKITETSPQETEEIKLEKSDFEEFVPKDEYTDPDSGKRLRRKFARNKKRTFFTMAGTIALTLFTAFFLFPFMSNLILSYTKICMIITSAFCLVGIISNCPMFLSLGKLFNGTADGDINVSLAAIATALYSVFGIITGETILNIQLLFMIILSVNSIKAFMKASAELRSLKQILGNQPKTAVALIDDPAIALAMTKGSIEGETLIAASQRVDNIEDFMKYTRYGVFLNGKTPIITVVSLILALLTGVLAGVLFRGVIYGLYSAAVVLCFAALPILSLIDALPFYDSSKKLNRKGAMIAGVTGAKLIEEANAVVLSSKDIFPSGTVTLHQMKVLSDNNLEDTLLRAASLTEAMQSPLAPIFKKIAGNSNITAFPDSDTVKYEEALGISGWVDNRLLFIGNRTLMEAHGISVPDVELDRKILRQGYFPVYVSDQNKACALLIVRYDADAKVCKELKQLTNSGVTLLVKTSDPNITEAMICDYLGLYEDTVKIMTAAGCHIYVNTVAPVKALSAPACYKTNPTALPAILNCAGKIRRSNILLTAGYIISAVFGVLLFGYASFGGSGYPLGDTAVLLYSIGTTILTYLLYLTQKP